MNKAIIIAVIAVLALTGCTESSTKKEQQVVAHQQEQYLIGQPVPVFDWSLERDLLIQLYTIRNQRVSTHSVWRSNYGMIEGDCPSIGYGLPYDTSLTNPLQPTDLNQEGRRQSQGALTSIGQAEPNGIYASTNTAATWIMCLGEGGAINPVYVESKVTSYPYPVSVDYESNRVARAGDSSVNLAISR